MRCSDYGVSVLGSGMRALYMGQDWEQVRVKTVQCSWVGTK